LSYQGTNLLKQKCNDNENCKWRGHFSLHIELKLQTLKEAKPKKRLLPQAQKLKHKSTVLDTTPGTSRNELSYTIAHED
jgi:hypothetical protein